MADEIQMHTLEKANQIPEKPFKVLTTDPREIYKTNYDWYIHKKGNPMIGRKIDNSFEVWKDGGWIAVNENDYWYDQKEKDGSVILGSNGKPKRKFYFDLYYEWQIEFKEPTEVLVYNREKKENCVETVTQLNLRVKRTLNKRMHEYLNDPRNKDTFMGITYDATASPSDMYGIKYMSN